MADRNNYTYISTNTTTNILAGVGNVASGKANEGLLHTINVGTPGAAGGSITIYDGVDATGELVGVINVPAASVPFSMTLDIQLNAGLTIVTAGMTAPNVIVTWR